METATMPVEAGVNTDVFDRMSALYNQDDEALRELAHIKRFLERYSGDHELRNRLLAGLVSLADAAKECGCELDVTSLQPVFHPAFVQFRADATLESWPLTYKWDSFLRSMFTLRNELCWAGSSKGLTPAFDQWRERNMSRCRFEIGVAGQGIVHPSIAFELSSGCSVGCWFCGISAEKFKGHFSLSGSGKAEWKATLEAAYHVLGVGMKSGFCYWATDPLDNPDYLGFLEEYDRLVGVIPQTTTAIPLRNVELTRGVLDMWTKKRGLINRFSVLSTGVLRRLHETFTPEEMLGVELVMQNKKSHGVVKFKAGRAGATAEAKKIDEELSEGTIACVTGFLVNIVEKTVRLVSPTTPSKNWPNGYIVFASATYESPEDLEKQMRTMIAMHMGQSIRSNDPIRFTEHVNFAAAEDSAAAVFSKWMRFESHDLDTIGPMIVPGDRTPMDLVRSAVSAGEDPVKAVVTIEHLWNAGVLIQDGIAEVA